MSFQTFPLHPAQQDIYIDQLINNEAPYYNMGGYVRITGPLDKEKFTAAVNSAPVFFDALKMRFDLNDPVPVIYVDEAYTKFELPELAFEEGEDKRERVEQWIKDQLATPFKIEKENMLTEQYLIRIADDEHWYYFKFHHLITDGYGISGIHQYIAKKYKSLVTGDEVAFKYPSYIEEAVKASSYYHSDDYAAEGEYWKKKVAQLPAKLLQRRYLPDNNLKTKCDTFIQEFSGAERSKLETLLSATNANLQQLTLAALMIYFNRTSQQSEFVFGVPLHRRRTKQLRTIPGMFTGVIPFTASYSEGTKVIDLIKSVLSSQREDYRYQNYLIGDLSRHFRINVADDALIEFVVNYAPIDFQLDFGDGLSSTLINIPSGHLPFPVEMFWYDYGQEQPLQLRIDFQSQYFEKEEIALLAQRILYILHQFNIMLDDDIGQINILPIEEQQLLTTLNNAGVSSLQEDPKMLTTLFSEQAARTPDAIAVVLEEKSLTYKELEERSNQLSHHLHSLGVKEDVLVPLCIERSIEMLVAILGIMKAGGAYVPLDPAYPAERISYILEDTAATVVICSRQTRELITADVQVVIADEFSGLQVDGPVVIPEAHHLCYVIYTSGSTGKPKGVMVEHRGMLNHLFAKIDDLKMDADTVLAFTASYTFDISVWQMFSALLCGGRTVVYTDELIYKPVSLISAVAHDGITVLELVPSYLAAVLQEEMDIPLEKLCYLMVTGEAVSRHLLSQWFSHKDYGAIPVVNAYGPTEASDDITHHIMYDTPVSINVPLGKPVRNLRIYILDDLMQVCPLGVPGEICVAGIGVARGYLGRAELTKEKFVKDPFSAALPGRMYRTGDLGRWLPDGTVEYLGRIDDQVKIRGYRIELGEIEHVLQQSDFVSQAVVIAREDAKGNKRLVGYIVPAANYNKDGLTGYLKGKLPEYMVPALVEMDALPLSANGKIDKKALPDATIETVVTNVYTAPRNKTEQTLVNIWQHLLQVEQIGVLDDFFELGGHSLLAMRLIAAITKELEVALTVRKLFQHPTIATLASYLQQQEKGTVLNITVQPRTARMPLSFSQERLWFIDKLEGSSHYHIPLVLRLKGKLNYNALQQALKDIVGRHEILRTVIREENGNGYQYIRAADDWQLENIDTDITAFIYRPFDLGADYMLRASVITLTEEEYILAITVHHIAADGWSAPVIIRELSTLYAAYVRQQDAELLPLPVQYADYAIWQRSYVTGKVLESQQAYWKKQLSGLEPLNLATDYPRPPVQGIKGSIFNVEIDSELSEKLYQFNQQYGVTLYMTLLSVCQVLLYRYTGQEDICVGTPLAGRNQQEVEDLIGFFVNTMAVRSELNGSLSFIALLQKVKETLLEGYEYQDLPFEEVVKVVSENRDMSRSPVFQVMFLLQDALDISRLSFDGVSVTTESVEHKISKFDLTFFITEKKNGLTLSIEYATDLFQHDTIVRMAGHYIQLLKAIAESPSQQIDTLQMLSAKEEEQLLLEFNESVDIQAGNRNIVEVFTAQVGNTPDATAVCYQDIKLTYRELDQLSNQLGHYLRSKGVKEDTLVPLYVDRGLEMIIGILGILKAGGAYVPVDTQYPADRVRFMLEDINSPYCLTTEGFEESLKAVLPASSNIICLDHTALSLLHEDRTQVITELLPHHLAYMIYTSGSTGTPKGVLLEHGGVVNLAAGQTIALRLQPGMRTLQFAAFGFDASCYEIFNTLLSGGCLVIPDKEDILSATRFHEFINRHAVEVATLPLSYLNVIKDNIPAAIKTIVSAGEALNSEVGRQIQSYGIRLINAYGPTENTVCATLSDDPLKENGKVVIGKPIPNVSIHILDKSGQLVPVGVPGELHIGGVQVAREYYNRAALTAEKFIEDPFALHARLYRSGDLARWLPDGNIEFLGRTDEQVKIRGYRIELGEIESVLQQSGLVHQAVILAKTDHKGNKQLVGYIVPGEQYDREQLSVYMKDRLPDYMLPLLVELDVLPLTTSGKIDKKALPDPVGELLRQRTYVAPGNETEQLLASIYEELLGVTNVGIYNDFFELGGHSLLAIRLIAAIRKELHVELTVKEVFLHRTVATLSGYVQQQSSRFVLPAIVAQERPAHIPLSFSQERLWFIDHLEGSTHYHISTVLKLKGNVNRDALQYALQSIIGRHEILRTVIKEEEGVAYQQILTADNWELKNVNTEAGITELAHQPFDLANDYTLRAGLWSQNNDEHALLITMHHIASDGWSVSILGKELSELYEAYIENRQHRLLPLPIQYADYAIWQKSYVTGDVLKQQQQYWVNKLSGLSPLNLPTDYVRPAIQRTNGAVISFTIDSDLTRKINELNQQQGVTLFMTLLSAFQVLLYRYSGQTDICVGTPLAGRKQQEEEALIGFFINTLAVRSDLSDNPSFTDLLHRVKETLLEGYEYQDMPFEKVVEAVVTTRDLSRNPLFQVMFVLQNMLEDNAFRLGDLSLSVEDYEENTAKFDLVFTMLPKGEELMLGIEYSTDLFTEETIVRMGHHYEQLLRSVVATPAEQIGVVNILTVEEKNNLQLMSEGPAIYYPEGQTFVHAFEEQVKNTPDALALKYETLELSYRQLDERANRVAHYLKLQGIQPDSMVPICMDRSLEMIIGVVGVWKAGGAYVPIDPKFPQDRISYMLEDCNATVVVSNRNSKTALPGNITATVISLDEDYEMLNSQPDYSPEIVSEPHHLAYVLYTSGSTGKPKGVLVEHIGLLNHLLAMVDEFSMNTETILAFTAPYTFDISVWQMVNTLICGGCTIIYPENLILRPDLLIRKVDEQQVTLLQLVPSYLTAVLQDEPDVTLRSLQYLLVTGEAVTRQLLAQWFAHEHYKSIPVVNAYGPTEASDDVSFYFMDNTPDAVNIPVGNPIQNLRLYVLDNQGQLCPQGIPGEICVAGIAVARGYLKRPELTAEKFVQDPFHAGDRMYKTGDLGRWLPDGNMEYLGRLDDQVKIRGFRIELGEIESVLQDYPLVSQAVVVAKSDDRGIKRLIGYVVPAGNLDRDVLVAYLKERLPEYMVPVIFTLEQLPLTANGKIDKKALPDLTSEALHTYTAPRNKNEQLLADIWQRLLGVEQIGIYDNFFERGGHSLLVIRLTAAIRKEMGVELQVKEVFMHPTIDALLAYLQLQDTTALLPAITVQLRPARIPLSYSQERLWFIDQLEGSTHYHIPAIFRLNGITNRNALQYALQGVINRHEALRTVIREEDGMPYQHVLPTDNWQLEEISADVDIPAFINRPFDLSADHMLRAGLITVTDTAHILVVAIHHIASDGWSSAIIVNELSALYTAYVEQREAELKMPEIQYADYAIWQRQYLQGEAMESLQHYWKQQLSGLESLSLPTDFTRPLVQSTKGAMLSFHVDSNLTTALNQLSKDQGATLFMTLMSALQVLLYRYTGQQDICVGTPVAGRSQQEVEDLVGFFINTLAIRGHLDGEQSFTTLLEQVKSTLLEGYAHQEMPFEKVVDVVVKNRDMSRSPLFQVMFVLQNVPDHSGWNMPGLALSEDEAELTTAKFDLIFVIEENCDGLALNIEYCTDLFMPDTISRMAGHYVQLLQAIAATPAAKLLTLPMLTQPEEETLLQTFTGFSVGYPEGKTIVTLFEEQVLRTPDAIAIVHNDNHLTYRELNERSNQLGHYLRSKGVKGDSLVPVCIDNGPDMIIALLGILKAGGAYVPIDPTYPEDRIRYMLEDTAAAIVISSSADSAVLQSVEIIEMDKDWDIISQHSLSSVPAVITPDNLAYVIYTSGSTGRPKGVLIEHKNVVRLFETETPLYDFNDSDVWTMFHSFCFDFSVWEMYGALFYGGRLVLVPKNIARDITLFGELLIREKVTILNQTPSSFYVLQDYLTARTNTISVRYVIFGGEALNPGKLKPWKAAYKDCRLINMYGITETTVHVTYKELEDEHLNSSASVIGKTIPTLSAYILDSACIPVPVGVTGELYIGGAGVARGYLNRAELTAERFVSNPFIAGERLYRTGDLARWYPDGNIEYLGRIDDQVKIRGFRIELGEIESCLQQSGLVSNSVVLARTGNTGDKQLVGYVVPEAAFSKDAVQSWLKERLPEYMVPALWVPLEEIPLTSNGKVDRKALPEPEAGKLLNNIYEAPQNETQEKLVNIWQELLGAERIGILDNFFELGGDSISIIRVVSKISRVFNKTVKVFEVYKSATILQLGELVDSRTVNHTHNIEVYNTVKDEIEMFRKNALAGLEDADLVEDIYPMSDIEKGMIYVSQLYPKEALYHDQFVCQIPKTFDAALLKNAYELLARKHSILRTAFRLDTDGNDLQIVYQSVTPNIPAFDIQSLNGNEIKIQVEQYLEQERGIPFVVDKAPLWRATVFYHRDWNLLAFQFHHAILDGWSVASLNTELFNLCTSLLNQPEQPTLPMLKCTYKDFIIENLVAKRSDDNGLFWKNELADYKRLDIFTEEQDYQVLEHTYDASFIALLKERTKKDNLSLKGLAFGAYLYALSLLTYEDELTLGLVTNNRPVLEDGDQLLGCFLNTIPFRFKLAAANGSWGEYFKEIEDKLLSLKERDRTSLFEITKITGEQSSHNNPFFDALFNFINFHVYDKLENEIIDKEPLSVNDYELTNTYLDCTVNTTGNIFQIQYSLRRKLKSGKTLADLLDYFNKAVSAYLEHYNEPVASNSIIPDVFNKTTVEYDLDQTLVSLFAKQVLNSPDAIALVHEGVTLTYGDLDKKSNQLAHYLKEKGVGEEMLIPVCMDRSPDLIVSILAILKTGAAYVPVDAGYPQDRITYMLEDCNSRLVITTLRYAHLCSDVELVCVDTPIWNGPDSSLSTDISAKQLAYVIYTSGSTGRPKGVMIEHRNVVNLVNWHIDAYEVSAESRATTMASIGFDAFGWEIWPYLCAGSTLFILDDNKRLSPEEVVKSYIANKITHSFIATGLVTDIISALHDHETALQYLLTGGDRLPAVEVSNLPFALVNNYGPTENTVVTTSYRLLSDNEDVIPFIGRPVSNSQVYIINGYLSLSPVGVAGELCISGTQLARGYLNLPVLTAEKFIAHPFIAGERLYRTGDLARWLPDGNIEYLGRTDEQVKIRGYRIELGEIENVLQQSGLVSQAVTLAKSDARGMKRLVAYVVPLNNFNKETLLAYLESKLPDYMVPLIVLLENMPLTANGKINRNVLPDPEATDFSTGIYVAPRNETEAKIATIWQQLLPVAQIGIYDNFFELGGHSLLAIRLLGIMRRELQAELEVKDLFAHATIAALAAYVTKASGKVLLPAITVQPKPDRIPLSFGQERLWFIDQLEGSLHYHTPAVLKLKGKVNQPALQLAIQQIINRHEILRTVIGQSAEDGIVYQQVLPQDQWKLETLTDDVISFIDKPFDLSADHMLRAGLITLGADEFILVIVMHHIASDGWSVGIIVNELTALYNAYTTQHPPLLKPLLIQYADYAIWERSYLTGAVLAHQQAYWEKQLAGLEPLNLPTDYPRPAVQSTNGAVVRFEIEDSLTDALHQLGRQQGTTLFMTLFSAFQVLLYRYSSQENICVGTPVAGRRQQEVEDLVGFFVNTLAVHTDLSGTPSFSELLQRVKATLLDGYEHQDMPFEKIVEAVVKTRDLSRSPLFQVFFVMQNGPATDGISLNEISVSAVENEHVVAQFDLTFTIAEEGEALLLSVDYCKDIFAEETIARMGRHFKQLLWSVVNDATQDINTLLMLPQEEENMLQQIGQGVLVDYPQTETFVSLFEAQAAQTPDATALVYEGKVLTYRELNEQANQLANYLITLGVKTDTLVAVCIERSLEMIIGIIGIMKAGAAYVPIDITYPAHRISYILEDANADVIISSKSTREVIPGTSVARIVVLDEIAQYPITSPAIVLAPQDLAYVIYTSGSTGTPKGVLIEHRGMLNHLFAKINELKLDATSIIAYTASYTFDISVWQMFAALLCGGRTIVYQEELILQPASFIKQVVADKVSILELVPSYLRALLQEEVEVIPEHLQYLLVTGEAVNQPLLEQWFSHKHYGGIPVVNAYGPTEASDDITHHFMHETPNGNSVPLGKPIQHMHISIWDKRGQLCAWGIPGEICVSGIGVARGYLNRPELTSEKFVTDPATGVRMYRTGDLGRWLPDGTVEYLGRMDDQVKIRGYRIELGEIEKVLQQHEQVIASVVVAKSGNLVGYIVCEGEADKEIIRTYLTRKLPEYMMPVLVILDKLPLTANGKVDRKLLPDPAGELLTNNLYVAPRNETEQVLVEIWEQLLGTEQIGVNDNFFERGGHSLLAIRLLALIRKRLEVELVVKDIFVYPTIATQSTYLQSQRNNNLLPPVTIQNRPAHIPLSFSQERLWFIDRLEGSTNYHIPGILKLKGRLDRERLQYALQGIINRHEVLRTVIHWSDEDNSAYQQVLEADGWQLTDIDTEPDEENVTAAIAAFIGLPFDLSAHHMLRVGLITLSAEDYILVIVTHHIASDGWSETIIVEELVELYNASEAKLLPMSLQYADYAIWQRNYLKGEVLDRQLEYWKKHLSGVATLDLPVDYVRPAVQSMKGAMADFTIDSTLKKELQQFSQQQGSTLFMTLLAAFKVLLYRYSGQDDICVGIPVAGRKQQEVEGLIGFFVNTLAVRSDLSGEPVFSDFLQQVKESLLLGYTYQDTPFEKVVDAVVENRDMGRSPLFQVMFVFQNMPETPALKLGDLSLSFGDAVHDTAKFDLTFVMNESEDGLTLSVEYCTDLFHSGTVARMAGHYIQLLNAITVSPSQQINRLPMLSISEEAQLLLEFNQPVDLQARNRTIVEVFTEQVNNTPDATAVWYQETKLTYRELDRLSNQLGHYLSDNGVKEDTLVPLYVDRGLEMIIGILGILKAGGAYVPVDTQYPADRVRFILEDINSPYCLTTAGFEESLKAVLPASSDIISLDHRTVGLLHKNRMPVITGLLPQHLAYMIYTSGSTGTPKGVLVEHGGVVSLTANMASALRLQPGMKTLQFAAFGFDASCYEIFDTLLSGGCLVIPDKDDILSATQFSEFINSHEVAVLMLPPSYLNVIKDNIPVAAKTIVSGGEALNSEIARQIQSAGIRLVNAYGPTENTVCSTLSDDPLKENGKVVIGKPLANVSIHILDKSGQLVPVGVPGEVHIGGLQVARGYLNRAALTAEKFIADPFAQHARLYRSGDLARWLPDGNIEYLGRTDEQVKIRGYRIELGEIESVLQQSGLVNQVVVLAKADDKGNKRLIGYVVPAGIFNSDALNGYLKERLPEYMIPALWVALTEIPLTASGKVNRKALPEPVMEGLADQSSYVAPRNEMEIGLATIWQDLLGIEKVGIHDNFFKLGGDSIITIQVISRAKWIGCALQPKDVFMHQTIAQLAAIATTRKNTDSIVKGEQGQLQGTAGLLPIQQWFFEEQPSVKSAIHHFNQSVLLNLDKKIDKEILEDVLTQLQTHHDALRFTYSGNDTHWEQRYSDEYTSLIEVDLTAVPESLLADAVTTCCDQNQAALNIADNELMRMVWIKTADTATHNRLLIVIHHLAVDGVSWRILLEDAEHLLEAAVKKERISLGEKSSSYRQWYNHLAQYGKSSRLLSQLPYWKQVTETAKNLPVDGNPDEAATVNDTNSFTIHLEADLTRQLLQEVSTAYNTEINDILLAALALTWSGWSGKQDVVVGLEGHGREDLGTGIDTSRTVGWFTNLYPVLLHINNSRDNSDLIKSIKEQLRQIPDKGLGYGVLKYLNKETSLQGATPWNILFNYLGQFDNITNAQGLFSYADESAGNEISSSYPMRGLLSINGMIQEGQLSFHWSYSNKHFESATIESLAVIYISHLKELITHCVKQGKVQQSFTPADYGLSGEVSYQKMDRFLNGNEDELEDIISF
ncbi:non-ribosomal peptide synthase domain TIGR01720/amino acid adenylation domain-containing protein [Chitinophaga sp. CF118]|uniref:non-ribosomal peptide synthetase n=1 Tax=Chitinophaga sp. CF118 TaxID=1884367 RepID=UPI0008F0A5DF|nr:non-ribosomal peptide synthetase [Chitinophaga sp. CF118]SFE91411.1 non-ribosomal peptide synthase domain TIGR01720/amino acid adenylation domain-containing protein [Chitinophaga sp. CF118]